MSAVEILLFRRAKARSCPNLRKARIAGSGIEEEYNRCMILLSAITDNMSINVRYSSHYFFLLDHLSKETSFSAFMEKLFSYGTLQQEEVQLATFGRKLTGTQDALIGYKLSMLKITDSHVLATSGKEFHPIVSRTGHADDTVEGTVFEVTQQEILQADRYEVGDYQRIFAPLRSGKSAWVYVKID